MFNRFEQGRPRPEDTERREEQGKLTAPEAWGQRVEEAMANQKSVQELAADLRRELSASGMTKEQQDDYLGQVEYAVRDEDGSSGSPEYVNDLLLQIGDMRMDLEDPEDEEDDY